MKQILYRHPFIYLLLGVTILKVNHVWGEACKETMKLVPAGVLMGVDPDFGSIAVSNTRSLWFDATEITGVCWMKVFEWGQRQGYCFSWYIDSLGFNGDEHPVDNVTFFDAVLWCNARSEMNLLDPCYTTENGFVYRRVTDSVKKCHFDRSGFRLPTAQEWEYAARASTTTRFYWGNSCNPYQANYLGGTNSYDMSTTDISNKLFLVGCKGKHGGTRGKGGTMPVASFKPNGYGLYDMAGNVSEWCWADTKEELQSYWHAGLKGGSWRSDSSEMRHHVKKNVLASDHLAVFVFRDIGFRCVRKADGNQMD
jgi:formylglycine-generating enzyme required for sulfatase activity